MPSSADVDAIRTGDDDIPAAVQYCGGGIGSAEVDTDYGHFILPGIPSGVIG
jgi:hypothetical protein